MMIFRYLIGLNLALFSSYLHAFSCFLTIVKDTCWIDYTVTVLAIDSANNNQLSSVTIPKGQFWSRQSFTCQPNQTLIYTATFTPTIWDGEEKKIYRMQRYWSLPASAKASEKAWEISICFPKEFAEVPFPPKAIGNCQCHFKEVPPIPL